jgi:hypothetical protein
MGCPNGQDIVVMGTGPTNLAPCDWCSAEPSLEEGAMLSTTVEPECRQRPLVMSYATTEPRSGEAAAADGAPAREATKVLAHDTIHPATDRVDAYGATARANSPAVH